MGLRDDSGCCPGRHGICATTLVHGYDHGFLCEMTVNFVRLDFDFVRNLLHMRNDIGFNVPWPCTSHQKTLGPLRSCLGRHADEPWVLGGKNFVNVRNGLGICGESTNITIGFRMEWHVCSDLRTTSVSVRLGPTWPRVVRGMALGSACAD